MKVVSAKEMAALETQAYSRGCSEKEFMDQAGKGVGLAVLNYLRKHRIPKNVIILCGKGNNTGDAFVAGIFLLESNCRVKAIQLDDPGHCSPLCQNNRKLFLEKKGEISNNLDFPTSGVIIDGIFGTGFKGKVREPHAELIDAANRSGLPIFAIDIPSGLDGNTGQVQGNVIRAKETLYLELPKQGFYLEDGWNIVGKLRKIHFGLPKDISEHASADFEEMSFSKISSLLPPLIRNRHKYQTGFTLGLAGSLHMPGAALLSSLAAFRGGSGMVRLFYPEGMDAELVSAPYELIKTPYRYDRPEELAPYLDKAGSVFIGPGISRTEQVRNFLVEIIPSIKQPCVIDADALFLYAKHPFPLPPRVIFTPHHGEMQALLNSSSHLTLNLDLLKICQKYADDHQLTLILKGAPTFVFQSGFPIYVSPRGDPGMATAGSGDVLTGLLAALLSQGLSCHQAALLGVYLHGFSGELAANERKVSYGMMASDLIDQFPQAYRNLGKNKF